MKLRKLEEKDAEGMLEWMRDPEIQKRFRFEAGKKSREDVLNFIRDAQIEPADGRDIHYAITDDNDEYLGTISLKHMDLTAKKAEYAISLRKKAQGKGIAKKATGLLLIKAFREYGLHRVYLNVLADNKTAIHLYERCGFSYEGEFREHLKIEGRYINLKWYGILENEFSEDMFGGVVYKRCRMTAVLSSMYRGAA